MVLALVGAQSPAQKRGERKTQCKGVGPIPLWMSQEGWENSREPEPELSSNPHKEKMYPQQTCVCVIGSADRVPCAAQTGKNEVVEVPLDSESTSPGLGGRLSGERT